MHTDGVGNCLGVERSRLYVLHALYVMSTPTHTVEERALEQFVCHGDLDIAVLVASDSQKLSTLTQLGVALPSVFQRKFCL